MTPLLLGFFFVLGIVCCIVSHKLVNGKRSGICIAYTILGLYTGGFILSLGAVILFLRWVAGDF